MPSPQTLTAYARTNAFQSAFARRAAERTVDVPGGFAALDDTYAHSRANNQVFIDGAPGSLDPRALPAVVDEVLAHLPHRMVSVLDDATGRACAPYLTEAGYTHSRYVVMLHEGPVPAAGAVRAARAAGAAAPAGPVGLEALRRPLARRWRGFLPVAGDEEIHHLVERRQTRLRGADSVRFIGARTPDGEVAAWADLYADPAAGTAQIEDLVTSEAHLGQGYGTAVLHAALRLAAHLPTRFLIADADDWPRHWYARHGFTVIGHSHNFDRS
ncbi:GNAT family N-acetyltransferase [Streptomyces sp. NPDC090022]|uniref:GNAT family N-acetyltransferase n=1 Tax=Streptomyces sp. NPDC090022 TaxID=3365920 RepID=UPI00380C8542